MASFLDKLFAAEKGQLAHLLVCGYIRHQQKLYSLNIPDGITIEFLKYFFIFKTFMFVNGMNILSRDWKSLYKDQMIEYDLDGDDRKGEESGVHVHKGILINIRESYGDFGRRFDGYSMRIKTEDGGYEDLPLCDVKIKLEINISVFMNGINILSRDWKRLYKNKTVEYHQEYHAACWDTSDHTHIRKAGKGTLVNINMSTFGSNDVIIKDGNGGYYVFHLYEIKIKLLDDGSRIITYEEGKHR